MTGVIDGTTVHRHRQTSLPPVSQRQSKLSGKCILCCPIADTDNVTSV